jgi:uncharacterized protein
MAPSRRCPICKRPLDEHEDRLRFRPFCSKRCADVDLGRWLKGAYAIQATEPEDGDDSDTAEAEREDGDKTPHARH